MQLETKTLRKSINKAFLKETVDRTSFNTFKGELRQLLDKIESAKKKGELEEHYKKPLNTFFEEVGFLEYNINTSDRIDLAIYTEGSVGVLFEVKSPTQKQDMITEADFNRKALQQAVLYYIEQRIEEENTDLKHVVVTNTFNWFVFDAQEFERCFYKPSTLKKVYKSWKSDQKVSSNKDFMYNEIANFIEEQDTTLRGLHLDLQEYGKLLEAKEGSKHEKKLIPLYKFFSPIHLLKESFANDSNTLNREFYQELLYILGLEEVKDGSTRYIERASEENRQPGSLIENTIRIIEAEDHLSRLNDRITKYGSDKEEQLFNIALELGITWMNRVLFLKLLEAQLYRYHRQDKNFKFLNPQTIDGYDELNKLFFQVLARRESERAEDVNEKFGHIPYLNSSLFDPSSLEHETLRISNLDDKKTLPVYNRSVLTDQRGDEVNTLQYLFEFLEAYDFAAEGGEEIQEERKTLINASVLGLIFEKINGYKDGSFFTPGFITEYMARETLRNAVIDKFEGYWDEDNLTFTDVYNRIGRKQEDIEKANEIVSSITICDPAVGSGHFLVSCLNELLAIKSDLGILCDKEGKLFHHVNIEIENDELIVTWGNEELFEYDVAPTWHGNNLSKRKIASDRQRIQKALFHEKRHIIENCLFGVDINPNSVKICRLRLWIELLKNTYYTERSDYQELEVLPNIDINIKTGNSLVSRFELDSDLSSVFKDSDHSLKDYKEAVKNYKHSGDRSEKQRLQQLIDDIKEEYSTTLINNRPINKKLSKQRGRLELMQNSDLFGEKKFTKKEIKKQEKKVKKLEEKKEKEESGVIFNNAFEWRFEFPEVLDKNGSFKGFDVILANPPYMRIQEIERTQANLRPYYSKIYNTADGSYEFANLFVEKAVELSHSKANNAFIFPHKFLNTNNAYPFRSWLMRNGFVDKIVHFGANMIFEDADTYTCILEFSKNPSEDFAFYRFNFEDEYQELMNDESIYTSIKLDQVKQASTLYGGNKWILFNNGSSYDLFEKIYEDSVIIQDVINIFVGLQTSSDRLYVFDLIEEKSDRYIGENKISDKKYEVEKKYFKPLLKGRDVHRYEDLKADKIVFFPYDLENDNSEIVSLDKFKKQTPLTYKYIKENEKHFKSRQSGKAATMKYWYAYIYEKNLTKFEQDRLSSMEICTNKPNVALNFKGLYHTTTIYSWVKNEGYDIDYKCLLAIANSNLMWWFLKFTGDTLRGDARRLKTTYLDPYPLPAKVTSGSQKEISDKVDEIMKADRENKTQTFKKLEKDIDQLVYKLYGLNEKEIGILEESVG